MVCEKNTIDDYCIILSRDLFYGRKVTILPFILFALFVIIPILEIATFIQVGSVVGLPMTLLGILLTAVIGAVLVRQQGFKAINDARENMAQQKSPVEQVIHGAFILISGLLLLTPGFLTDGIGFLFLIPPLRLAIARKVWLWIKNSETIIINTSATSGHYHSSSSRQGDTTIIDGEAVEVKVSEKPNDSTSPRLPPNKQ